MPSSPPPPHSAVPRSSTVRAAGGRDPHAFYVVSHGPLLLMHFPPVIDGAVVESMMSAFDRALAQGGRFAVVMDATETRRLPGAQEREALARWLQDEARQRREREVNVGAAVIVSSGLVRAFVAAIYFVRKPITPQHWAATLAEGVEWACTRLAAEGVPLTPELERLRDDLAHG